VVERLYRIVSTSFTFHNILKDYFILRHRHETHSIVCTKYESKGIIEKFTVLMKGHIK